MINRLQGESGRQEATRLLKKQSLVEYDLQRADFLLNNGCLESFDTGASLIAFGDSSTDVFFLLTGRVQIHIGKHILVDAFHDGNHIGEIAALETVTRSASVTALEQVVALKVSKDIFLEFLEAHPTACMALTMEFAKRLERRNQAVTKPGRRIRLFAISSAEALHVALTGSSFFAHHENFEFIPWPADVFRNMSYPMDDLEAELDRADFAIAIAQADDVVESRDVKSITPRDNVLFELGLFMGRLGRKRTLLMVPRGTEVKLPSDLTGLTTVRYSPDIASERFRELETWNEVKRHIEGLI